MFKGVLRVWGYPSPKYQFGAYELSQSAIELLLRHIRRSADEFIRERTSERGADLSYLACRGEAIQARQQGCMQRGRNRQGCHRPRHRVMVACLGDEAAFHHGLS